MTTLSALLRHVRALVTAGALAIGSGVAAQPAGRFVEIAAAPSAGITPPHVVVWLPPGYDTSRRRYPVAYMHDGQNLFFAERSNFNKVWAADRSALRLIAARRVRPFIIVGIDQPGEARFRQYLPQALAAAASPGLRAVLMRTAAGPLLGDAYLRFLVDELKPMIDRQYRTLPGPADTAIIGSSMGGLISCHAFLQAPQVFGRAGCVSTHWPLANPAETAPYSTEIVALWAAAMRRVAARGIIGTASMRTPSTSTSMRVPRSCTPRRSSRTGSPLASEMRSSSAL